MPVRNWMTEQIVERLDPSLIWQQTPESRKVVFQHFQRLYKHAQLNLPEEMQKRLFESVVNETLGYGPIDPFLRDPSVSEVMVNGPSQVYIERDGKLVETDVRFESDEHALRIAQRIVKPMARPLDRAHPRADARLPDGSRVNIVIPPASLPGTVITIRKFPADPLTIDDLLEFGTLTPEAVELLRACVVSRLNCVVSGGTGSGKTTLLNILSSFIPEEERIVTIEDAAELQLHQSHVVGLETVAPLPDGTGRVEIRDLVINSLRMRPDRIIVGECRGGEALDMLQAMNTGHDGSLTTVHANSPRDAISRLETLCLMAGFELPITVIRRQIASAVDLIIQQERRSDGSRKVMQITEVQGMEGKNVVLQDIFLYQQPPFEGEGKLEPTGIRPRFMPRLEEADFDLSAEVFGMPNFGKKNKRR